MSLWRIVCLAGACSAAAVAQIEVGQGAPNGTSQQAFIDAWLRNGFNTMVADPTAAVAKYGTTGLIQQFPSTAATGGTLALIKADANTSGAAYQVFAAMFAYYSTVGVSTAGYPTQDTQTCPALKTPANSSNSCQWQSFTTNYALFVYTSAIGTGKNFATRDPYYTRWAALGGIATLGPAISAETTITSKFNTNASVQTFDQGAIYSITSGTLNGRLMAVKEPVYDLYVANGAHSGLGTPVTDELLLANGNYRQSFEGGSIDYDPATGIAVLRAPILRIATSPSGSLAMLAGDTLTAQATVVGSDGGFLTDRAITWNSSNGRVVQVTPQGLRATLKAIGAGTAVITVSGEGKVSSPLTISVTAPCCQIGEGAPTAAVRQAFQDAITRNRLTVQVPVTSLAVRVGNGYVQEFVTTGANPVAYLVAVADGSTAGYVVTGTILQRYYDLGGPAGSMGYPTADATPGGRQNFQKGSLAGLPVQVVSGAILTKWASLTYELGPAGPPTNAAANFLSFRGTAGTIQSFRNATLVAHSTGSLAGRAFAVLGPVQAKYLEAGAAGGDLGAPIGDERLTGGVNRQDFEGGSIAYAPGSTDATVTPSARQPVVTATPGSVLSGTPVHLVVGGFNNGAAVRVSQTGQADFQATLANGTYAWDVWVPAAAASGTITVRAAEVGGTASSQATYAVRNAASSALTLAIVTGDRQSGAPGAQLAQPLVVALQDSNGTPVPGQAVTFAASQGGQITPVSAVTDANGQANAILRLASNAGIVLATAQAARQVVTFSARAAAVSLTNFPTATVAVDGTVGNGSDSIRQKGSMLAAVAAILKYHQQQGDLPQPNGVADTLALNQFLKSLCVADSQGAQVCDGFVTTGDGGEQIVNLWRVGGFVTGAVEVQVEQPDVASIRDLVSAGSPVLLALALNGLGSHFVVATGVAADGSLTIADPAFWQTNLGAFLNGFTRGDASVKGTLAGAARLLPQAPKPNEFVVMANAPIALTSPTGACGPALSFPSQAAVAGTAANPATVYFRSCDGLAGRYQLDAAAAARFTDLSPAGSVVAVSGASSGITRNGTRWNIGPLVLSIAASGVVNAASFTADVAAGGIVSIFGSGFVRQGSATTVEIGGQAAALLGVFPFQVNAQIPAQVPVGSADLTVTSGNGSDHFSLAVKDVAPGIFTIGADQAAITNQDNSLNTPSNPAVRGGVLVIYGTGFGAVSRSGGLDRATTPVRAVIGSAEVEAAFAGLTPGAIGLYQANVAIPANLPPGLSLPLYLKQGPAVSNTVSVAVQ